MPIYEYECPTCGQFELLRKITDPPLKKCPTCKKAVKKLMSNTSFQLKGTGWYVTDYGKSGSSDTKASTDTKKSDTAKEPSSKAESTKKESSTKSSDTKGAAAA